MSFARSSSRLGRAVEKTLQGAGTKYSTPTPAVLSQAQSLRSYAVGATTAAAAAAGSGAVLRVMGYEIPWPAIVAGSMAAAVGAYGYGTMKIAEVDRKPLTAEVHKIPHIPGGTQLRNQDGKVIDLQAALSSKYAVLAFGTLHSSDTRVIDTIGRAAESAKQKTGFAVVPVFISLDPVHDTSLLKTAAGRAGVPGSLALTGNCRELLTCVERFKNKMTAEADARSMTDEKIKKGGEVAGASGFISDHVYVADPSGQFITIMPKTLDASEMGAILAEEVQRTSLRA